MGGVRLTHAASLLTDQVHSRFVEIRTVLAPPSAAKARCSACAWTSHRGCEGVVIVSEEEPHDPEANRAVIAQHAITFRTDGEARGMS
jgi:hypothetical protein